MYAVDFGFERQVMEEGGERVLRSGIKVTDDHQPPTKKSKADTFPEIHGPNTEEAADHNIKSSQFSEYW
jgi:hypothetical protein